ncbi:hypothetical protein, partial, partial [Parasitella parasitica]
YKEDGVDVKYPQCVWLYISDNMVGRRARLEEKGQNRASAVVSTEIASPEDDPANWTRIMPKSEIVYDARSKGLSVKRTQFPLLPAAALTIHKSQGSTYDKVLLDCRSQPRLRRDALYVACSRARHADNLYIIADEIPNPEPIHTLSDLHVELQRQKNVELVPVFAALRENCLKYQIIFHNIQSFFAHHSLVSPDDFYMQSYILLFAETWTTQQQNTNIIPGFDTVARVDVASAKPVAY